MKVVIDKLKLMQVTFDMKVVIDKLKLINQLLGSDHRSLLLSSSKPIIMLLSFLFKDTV